MGGLPFASKPVFPTTPVILKDNGVIVQLQMTESMNVRGITKTTQPGLLIVKNNKGIYPYAPAEMLDAKDRLASLSINTAVYVFDIDNQIIISSIEDVDWKNHFNPETKFYSKVHNFVGIFILHAALIMLEFIYRISKYYKKRQ